MKKIIFMIIIICSLFLTGCDIEDFNFQLNDPEINDPEVNDPDIDNPDINDPGERKITVTFDGNGGTLISGEEVQIVSDSGLLVPPVYEKEGYDFVGWDRDFDILSDTTLNAVWKEKINYIDVELDADGGNIKFVGKEDCYIVDNILKVPEGTKIENLYARKDGYELVGWYLDDSKFDFDTIIVSPIKLTAHWEVELIELIIRVTKSNSSDIIIKQAAGTDITVEITIPEVTGYTFMGWSSPIPEKMPNKHTLISGIWVAHTCLTIKYNDEVTEDIDICQAPNTDVNINIENPTKLGYIFMGWSSPFPTKMPEENITIYAIWEPQVHFKIGEQGLTITGLSDKNIKDLVILENYGPPVIGIAKNAFSYCNNLETVVLPNTITSIDAKTFYNCENLKSINIPTGLTSIGDSAFESCRSLANITIPDTVKSIGESAFANCISLKSITLPNTVTSIKNKLFFDCPSLISIKIGDKVTSIGENAFACCENITSITLPDSLTSIGDGAFYSCKGLTSITIPENVTSIGDSSFMFCSNLKSITLPFVGNSLNGTTNTHFGYIFGHATYEEHDLVPHSLKEVIITKAISIDKNAFYECASITSITIPDSVTSIGESAFYHCVNLSSLKIGNNVKIIEDSAFANCVNLTSITFNGTKEQWQSITKHANWNDSTGKYTIHCIDGDIIK